LLFLDEPTTGVDPISRGKLMKLIKRLVSTSIILTTHRMDEAEAICDKIAIMINGQFACYGTPDQLKQDYAKSYKITIIHRKIYDDIKEEFEERFTDIEFQETMIERNTYYKSFLYVPLENLKLSYIFEELMNMVR